MLAESWEFQGKKWVFHLEEGRYAFHGTPLIAQDVTYSINRMKNDKKSLQQSNFVDVTETQAVDDFTVVITTEVPNAVFLDRLHNRFFASKVAADKYGDQVDQNPVGTGPYKLVSWQRDGNLVMTRNDDYWGPKGVIKEIVLKKVGEDAGRVAGPAGRPGRCYQ